MHKIDHQRSVTLVISLHSHTDTDNLQGTVTYVILNNPQSVETPCINHSLVLLVVLRYIEKLMQKTNKQTNSTTLTT